MGWGGGAGAPARWRSGCTFGYALLDAVGPTWVQLA